LQAALVYPGRVAVLLAAVLSGLFGMVSRGPITPLCQEGQPCSEPAAGVRLTFLHDGRAVRSVVTSSTGRYRVLLPAGPYTVRVAKASPIERLKPSSVTVRRGAMTRRSFFIDTGIR
jgi:carboxypeptidase family protein